MTAYTGYVVACVAVRWIGHSDQFLFLAPLALHAFQGRGIGGGLSLPAM